MTADLVTKYDPRWNEWFAELRQFIAAPIENKFMAIEHVGSTSIEGMVAKPVIDIDVVIEKENFAAVKGGLLSLGYVDEGDKGIAGREAFRIRDEKLKNALPPHHLYVCFKDSQALFEHLAFRDFLRENAGYREKLSRLKLDLARKFNNDKPLYIEGKSDLVQEITRLAMKKGEKSMQKTGVFIKFTAQAGRAKELAEHLLNAAESYEGETGTQIFAIHLSPIEPDAVFVYEIYESAAAKEFHENQPNYPAIREKTGGFLAGAPEVMSLIPLGGKGLN